MSNDLTVAKTILEQMGGGRLMALTGARSLVGNENSLQFSLKSGARDGINKVRIEANTDGCVQGEFLSDTRYTGHRNIEAMRTFTQKICRMFSNRRRDCTPR